MNHFIFFCRQSVIFLCFLIFLSLFGCYSRFQIQQSRLAKIQNIKGLTFFLIDQESPASGIWVLSNATFHEDSFSGSIDRANETYVNKITSIRNNSDRKASKDFVLIYLNAQAVNRLTDATTIQLDYTNIAQIEVFEPDDKKVAKNILIGLGGGAAALLIACNCPHIYTQTPSGDRQLAGSLYSGAAFPKLERNDYLPLEHIQHVENQYQIWIVNQEAQRQHTNMVSLEIIDHEPGIQALFDKYGNLHTLKSPEAPFEATNASGRDVLQEVISQDQNTFFGDLQNPAMDGVEKLTLSFAKPAGAKKAKLLLRAKTDQWVDYIYHEFQNGLGQYADEINQKYSRKSAVENENWMVKQKLPISVWLETSPGNWEKTDHFALAGGSAFRNDVMLLDLSAIDQDVVRIRLEFGFHFWDVDRVALDFSHNQAVQHTTLRPRSVLNRQGDDVTLNLTDDDGLYYHQPNIGDEACMYFDIIPLAPGMKRSILLRAKGYYEILHENAPGRPSLFQLNAWKKENALPRLSVERWKGAHSISKSQ